MSEVIGFVGAGQMGEPMVQRLVAAGKQVVLYARRPEVREKLGAEGATIVDSVAEAAARADVLILCLFSDVQLAEIAEGPDGFMANMKPGGVVVSHTTGNVSTLQRLVDQYPDGPAIVDGPISGSAKDIANGVLTVLLGGPETAVKPAEAVVAAYSKEVIRTGELGTALNLKLVNNILFAANAQLAAAAVELGAKLGIEQEDLLNALQHCSGRSYALGAVKGTGGPERFTKAAGPFLRKDVKAAALAAADSGVDVGWLKDVVDGGPLDLS
ncbi:NAD-binding protein [Gordonia amarae]|uniref:NAD-binding protein n=2 Tax=Gordonia amarae TaxID=36821 RepID=A0A857L294_9ACTN|nr:NAD(P)-dependent oxidoreductase [Gordonia amarae]MCS3880716.1 3-hydroxyisobutyrate dehydrogenase-like beta-hydroxyacid dehydrogenase [Gordonia amarae]QHN19010.1 NAD-binding protein [Gordonia amarae]QHN23485.1 NAD-binding protein [Gordonia amarae]QHN32385.1 NAD-binding protein [Gordonia amarae]QHN41133.1 NAD-binding protein [Gordonia amarae]